ncbi:hypothetical protein HME9302_00957 [Alteripontixanthobacter maritimus]|uniref:Uncharacterized protein n=1 Tax=Alteripontixanthobacter maritimus TaxID=2161824 RepID=A0A369Q5J9_9SPHN|nr:hypothetical protein HME9302_00957 [Alteripontixanthobacter maritimus]
MRPPSIPDSETDGTLIWPRDFTDLAGWQAKVREQQAADNAPHHRMGSSVCTIPDCGQPEGTHCTMTGCPGSSLSRSFHSTSNSPKGHR